MQVLVEAESLSFWHFGNKLQKNEQGYYNTHETLIFFITWNYLKLVKVVVAYLIIINEIIKFVFGTDQEINSFALQAF